MFVEFRGRKLLAFGRPAGEMNELGFFLQDVVEVLENGFDCASGGKRREGVSEKCLRKEGRLLRVVVAEGFYGYPDGFREEVYYVVHVSEETWKPRRWF